MRFMTARQGFSAVALVAAGLALTACGPDHTGASPSASSGTAGSTGSTTSGGTSTVGSGSSGGSSSGGTTGAGTSSGGTSGGGTSSGGTSGGGAGAVPACTTAHLRAATGNLDAGAGSVTFDLTFTNTGGSACALAGYPGVSFTDAKGDQLGNPADRTGGGASNVIIIPNGHAVAGVKTADGQSGYTTKQCRLTEVASLRVYPPDQKASLDVPWHQRECVGPTIHSLQVGPVHPVS